MPSSLPDKPTARPPAATIAATRPRTLLELPCVLKRCIPKTCWHAVLRPLFSRPRTISATSTVGASETRKPATSQLSGFGLAAAC
eukprot:695995-Amphidinium_carterae.1